MATLKIFRGIQTYPLLEKYGIINLEEPKYLNDIKNITKEIVNVIKNGNKKYKVTQLKYYEKSDPLRYKYIDIPFYNKCNIKELHILLKDYSEFEAVVLFNKKNIDDNYFIYKNGKVEKCTLLVYVPFIRWADQRIDHIIEHELKHLYDLITEYHGNSELMNKDIIYSETDQELLYNSNSLTLEDLISYNNLYKKYYYNSITNILPIMSDMLYYMNKSEISARLLQVKYKENIQNIKRLYQEYYKFCNNILVYASDNVKKYINNKFIINANYSSIYNISFKNSNDAYQSNVKKLMNFYIKRISHFLKQCDKLLSYKTESIINNLNIPRDPHKKQKFIMHKLYG